MCEGDDEYSHRIDGSIFSPLCSFRHTSARFQLNQVYSNDMSSHLLTRMSKYILIVLAGLGIVYYLFLV